MKRKVEKEDLKWLEDKTILLTPTGSYAYGTNIKESDKDYKGVCIPPKEFYVGLGAFNQYSSKDGKNFKNKKDDVDIDILHLSKFVLSCMRADPVNLELLFIEEKEYLKLTDVGKELRDNRFNFLSQEVYRHYGGFAQSQVKKMTKGNREVGKEYDTKTYMHAVRLYDMALELLLVGDTETRRMNSDYLKELRNGKHTYKEAIENLEYKEEELNKAQKVTVLPDKVDKEKINRLLIDLTERGLNYM